MFSISVLALALTVAACGGSEVPRPVAPAVAAAPDREIAGWSAPPAVAGARASRLSEAFGSGAALQRWGYLEGDGGRNRFRVRDGALEVLPARAPWSDAERGFYLYRAVRGDFDARIRLRARALSGLLVRADPAAEGDPENWVALRTDGYRLERASTRRSRTRPVNRRSFRADAELRVVRRGSRFTLLARQGGGWRRAGSLLRADLPRTLQVGIAASGPGRARVEHVRFVR